VCSSFYDFVHVVVDGRCSWGLRDWIFVVSLVVLFSAYCYVMSETLICYLCIILCFLIRRILLCCAVFLTTLTYFSVTGYCTLNVFMRSLRTLVIPNCSKLVCAVMRCVPH
jgi:hypothetical protein